MERVAAAGEQDMTTEEKIDVPVEKLQAIKERLRNAGAFGAKSDVKEGSSAPESKDTETEKKPKDGPRAETKAEAGEGDQRVPFERFKEVNDGYKAEKTKREAVEREFAALSKKVKDSNIDDLDGILSEEKKPKGFDEWDLDRQSAWVARQAAKREVSAELGEYLPEIKKIAMHSKIQRELGVDLREPQAEAIAEVLRTSPSLSAADALAVAKSRSPEVFKAKRGEEKPPSHFGLEPGHGRIEEATPRDDRGRFAREMRESRTFTDRKRAVAAEIRKHIFNK